MAKDKKIRPWPVSERAKAIEEGKGFQKVIAAILAKKSKKT